MLENLCCSAKAEGCICSLVKWADTAFCLCTYGESVKTIHHGWCDCGTSKYGGFSENTSRLTNAGLMLIQLRRRCTSIKPTLVLVFARYRQNLTTTAPHLPRDGSQANTRRWPYSGSILGHRLRAGPTSNQHWVNASCVMVSRPRDTVCRWIMTIVWRVQMQPKIHPEGVVRSVLDQCWIYIG